MYRQFKQATCTEAQPLVGTWHLKTVGLNSPRLLKEYLLEVPSATLLLYPLKHPVFLYPELIINLKVKLSLKKLMKFSIDMNLLVAVLNVEL